MFISKQEFSNGYICIQYETILLKDKPCQYDIQQHKTGTGLSHTNALSTSLAPDGEQIEVGNIFRA